MDLLLKSGFGDEKLSLENLCENYEEQTGKTITKQSLQDRFTEKLTKLIYRVLEQVLAVNTVELEAELTANKPFHTILVKDSTSFGLPESLKDFFAGCGGSGSKAAIKIQFEYDFLTGKIRELTIGHGKDSDLSNARKTVVNLKAGDLRINDLGYVETALLPEIESIGAYYLFRLQTDVNVYRKKGDKYVKIDFAVFERFMKINKLLAYEIRAFIGEKEKHKTRLVIELVPDFVKAERIEKIKKEAKSRNRQPKKTTLDRSGLSLFITNLSSEELNTCQVRKLYRVRWQVELIFKIWKSIGKLHCVQKMKYDRFVSCLYAKLLWFFLNWKILWTISTNLFYSKEKLVSFYKAFKSLSKKKDSSCSIVTHSIEAIKQFIKKVEKKTERYYLLEKRSKKLSSLEILLQYYLGFENQ